MTDRHARPRSYPPRRRGSTARTGLLIALGMGVISAGVVVYFIASSPKRTQGAEPPKGEAPPQTSPSDPTAAKQGRSGVAVGAGKGLSVQVASRSDPTRLAGTITSRTLEPLEANRYTAVRPESFIYLRDGRTIFVRADSAKLYIPKSSDQPESGTLTGNVEISLFDRRDGGVDPARDTPSLKLTTQDFAFDLTAWDFFMPGDVRIVGPTLTYLGAELHLLLNQPQERVELLRIARSTELRLRSGGQAVARSSNAPTSNTTETKPAARNESPSVVASPAPHPTIPDAAAGSAADQTRAFYHAVLAQTVRVTQGERVIEAATLDLWAHLIGGQLPPNAISPVRTDPSAQVDKPPAFTATTTPRPTSAPTETPQATDRAPHVTGEPDIVITWAGPLEMRPLSDRPAELSRDDVSLRFTSADGAPVRFAETGARAGLSGVASRLEYGATSRTIALAADEPGGVGIDLARAGRLRCTGLDLDLGNGLATVTGAGSVAGIVGTGFTDTPGPLNEGIEDRVVRWSNAAEFRFATGSEGIDGSLLSAVMIGDVEAIDHASSLRGNALAANFYERSGRTGPLSRLAVAGNAAADDGRGGALNCERLDIAFRRRDNAPDQSDPGWITASGSATAARASEVLGADLIEVTIERDAEGRSQVADLLADGGAVYERDDGVWAAAPQIRASATRRTAAMSGEGAAAGKGASRVTGTQIELDGNTRIATVFGKGAFAHHGPDAEGRPLDADASWSRSMTFDDRAGVLEARGATHATIRPDAMTVRELDAGSIRIELTPGADGTNTGIGGAPLTTEPSQARRVLRVEAVGTSLEEKDGGRASITSRIYEPADAPDGRRLAEELRLEGDRILADDERGTLDVPGAGVLRIVDVRATPSGENTAPDHPPATELASRGAARFEWDGSLVLDRTAGTATMRQNVRMRHLPLDRSEMTELVGEEVVAYVSEMQNVGAAGAVRGRLVRASAIGAVWARLGTKELTADRLEYLTTERLIRAASNSENDVVLFDPARPTPLKAKILEWDLARDRVEVRSPGTIVIPR